MPHLTRPHCELYYEVHGVDRGRPPLVFLHGLGGNHLSWWQQLAHFADDHLCVTLAHRGFGLSHEAAGGPGPHGFAADLAALLEHLALREPVLVAQSMGGWTATLHLAAHPGSVRGLVLACTTGAIAHPELDEILAAHFAVDPGLPAGVSPAAGPRMLREQPAMHFLYTELDRLSPAIDKTAVRAALLALRGLPLATLDDVPLLCITGAEDLLIPPAAVTWLAEHVPGARLHHEPEAGHSVYWERPARFNKLVAQFLAQLP
jgi:3-oxoadipate enol-lactonase